MKIFMHICCGPCTAYPLEFLRDEGHEVSGFFFNPNIHPFREFKKRLASTDLFAARMGFKIESVREYGLKEYLRQVVFNEEKRCDLCYEMRLLVVAQKAKEVGADAFTTTLLYSRYQKHERICAIAERLAADHGIPFYYQDFRRGWQQGIDMAIEMDLYRQPYCGCIYSEQERYDKKLRRAAGKVMNK